MFLLIAGKRQADVYGSLIHKANSVSVLARLGYEISSLVQCNSSFYYDAYKSLTGLKISWPVSCGEDVRCQLIIHSLEKYLTPYIKLDHICGLSLSVLDELTVRNMLDVFLALLQNCPLDPQSAGMLVH